MATVDGSMGASPQFDASYALWAIVSASETLVSVSETAVSPTKRDISDVETNVSDAEMVVSDAETGVGVETVVSASKRSFRTPNGCENEGVRKSVSTLC